MPTYDFDSLFINEYRHLAPDRQALFLDAVRMLVTDLKAGGPIRSSLGVKPVQGYKQIFEMTWERHNGRATFSYGTPRRLAMFISTGAELATTASSNRPSAG